MKTIYPPFLDPILDRCPKAGLTYVKLWRNKDKNLELSCEKSKVFEDFCSTWACLINNLRRLSKENVLNFHVKTNGDIKITLYAPEDVVGEEC